MKHKCLLIFIMLPYIFLGQIETVSENDINFKDVVEKKGLLYFKADTTLVTGRVIKYNRKKEAKRYAIVENGLPDKSGWIDINNNDKIKYNELPIKKPVFYEVTNSSTWVSGQTNSDIYRLNRKNTNFVNENIKIEKNYTNPDDIEIDTNKEESIVLEGNDKSKKDGIWEEYYENEHKALEVTYLNDKIEGVCKEWYENGQLKEKGRYKDGKKEGRFDTYHPNGQLKGRVNYLEGRENGEMMVYNEDGEIMIIGFFKDGIQKGDWKYFENGTLVKTENFD